MRLPKYIYAHHGNKYQVLIPKLEDKGKSNHYIGTFDTLENAIQARIDFLDNLK